jgi:hypothetical protein
MECQIHFARLGSFLFLISLLFLTVPVLSQAKNTGTFKGKLVDSALQQNLKGATISVLNGNDSTLVSYGLSKEDGTFQIDYIPFGNYIGLITFLGYQEIRKEFSLNSNQNEYNTGILYLLETAPVLEEVLIKTSPILIKGDTTEFNAGQFKTIPNATAEDLLKKLPGMEVERDGSVKSNGEPVARILVDGKRFFGNDPKMATRNLTTDIIDKIQVIDAQSDQSQFSGFDDGERIKTINIITKKDRRKGDFGKASFAAGNSGRFANAVSANRFNGDQKISFIGQTNNINNQNFSIQDFLGTNAGGGKNGGNSKGGANIFSGNASGIAKTVAGGLNYDDVWGKNTDADGNYFYSKVNSTNNRDRFRETFVINDSSLFNTNQFRSANINQNHRFDFNLDHRFDTLNSVLVRPNYSYQQTNTYSETNSHTTKGQLTNLNDVRSIASAENSGYNFNNSILFRHRFKKRGRTFSLNVIQNLNANNRYSTNVSYNNRYSQGIDTISQVSTILKDSKTYGANFSYTEPLSMSMQLELTYNYSYNRNNSDQQTYKLDMVTGKYTIAVPNLTNLFQNTNATQTAGANYRMQINPQWNYSLGMAVQHADLTSRNFSKNTLLEQSFNNLFPNLNVQFRKSRTANFRFNYRGSTRQPDITQLQDVIDNSNLLHIRSGNPALKQEFSNTFGLAYTAFNRMTYHSLSVNVNGSFVSNKIANTNIINTSKDSLLVDGYYLIPGAQFSKPQNLNGAFNINGNINFSFPVIKQRSTMHLGGRFNYNRDVNLYNSTPSFTLSYAYTASVRLTMNLKERFDLNFSSVSNYNRVRYSTENRENNDYFTQRFVIEPTYTTKNNWILFNDFDCFMNRGQSAGYDQTIPLWNVGLARLFLKRKEAELRLTVFDLLNANKSITRNVEQNFIEDVRTQVLNRYFLVSFTYHLRKFKGPQKQDKNSGSMKQSNGTGFGNNNLEMKGRKRGN